MAKEPKMVTCKHCGAEIAASANLSEMPRR